MRTSIRAHAFSTCLFAKGILKVICTEAFLCEDKVAQLKHGGKHLPAHRQRRDPINPWCYPVKRSENIGSLLLRFPFAMKIICNGS